MRNSGVFGQLTGNRSFNVSAHFCREIDDDGAGLHALDHLLRDENGRLLAGNQGCRDEDVDLFTLLGEQRHFGCDELWRHFLGVTAGAFARLFELDREKLAALSFSMSALLNLDETLTRD